MRLAAALTGSFLLLLFAGCRGDAGNSSASSTPATVPPVLTMISPTFGMEPYLFRNGAFTLLKDINPSGDSSAAGYTPMGENVYFSADDGVHGNELWVTNGTTVGTRMVKDIVPGALGSTPWFGAEVFDGKLFFFVKDSAVGTSLWSTDGTEADTVLVKDLDATTETASATSPSSFTLFAGKLFFTADDTTHGNELWVSDGTTAGTTLFKDIAAMGSSDPDYLVVSGGKLFFMANDGTNGAELWASDGTVAGTNLVKDINPTPGAGMGMSNAMTAFNNQVYFQATDGTHGVELWVSDGTSAGTTMLKDINTIGAGSSYPDYMTPFGGKLYFQATDGTTGLELWVSDGTGPGTFLLKDINTASLGASSSPDFFYVYGGKLHFLADDGSHGKEPWVTDGTAGGTLLIADIDPGAVGSNAVSLDFLKRLFVTPVDLGGNYLVGNDGTHGFEIFSSDGLPGGTTSLVTDFNPGLPDGVPVP